MLGNPAVPEDVSSGEAVVPCTLALFCGGGVALGLKKAVFQVVGVEIKPQPDYLDAVFVGMDIQSMIYAMLPRQGL